MQECLFLFLFVFLFQYLFQITDVFVTWLLPMQFGVVDGWMRCLVIGDWTRGQGFSRHRQR